MSTPTPVIAAHFGDFADVKTLQGDITFHQCNAINKIISWQAVGAQKFRGVWFEV